MLFNTTRSVLYLLSFIALIVVPFNFLSAQNLSNIFEPSVEISLTPTNPGPNTPVTATLTTNSFDLNAAFIGWAINGKVVSQGVGEKIFSFQTGAGGQIIRLEAILQIPNSTDVVRRQITIAPAELDIIWESRGYTPPFYEGKARAVLQSTLVFTAIPQIYTQNGKVPASDLVYTWSKNKSVLQGSSGYGRNFIVIEQDFLSRPFTLTVVVTTRDGQITVEKSVSINPGKPELVLYEEDPLLGFRLEKGITNSFDLQKEELWLRAVPYFSDISDRGNGLTDAMWRMNGHTVKEGPLEEKLVLRRPSGVEEGRVNISLSVENENKLLQSLQESFSILIKPITNNSVF
ncbi:MAG: hypothetical protein COV34_03550 [Candidatus Zambryskibacteria bacterium CG10_big_fil_rev_8_21_14_0_10_42_12]|uniref:Uncharacterized protein n=1 Tax=Candidatus Zambryskibacteria bacterium CG10_big_fil_rev_8_21_14_0_10_42_12 TaxID=1975115 RepID=A0A2H0QSN4_9BACT|nr:MAG: hypothetical protein COV34_03550 [Candidatus Zambryskibacteria bacterium CG10_big_fil_rev_8_21_14_0_10_42_12]